MTRYPEVLLPRRTYPMLENEDVRDNTLARETTVNVYQFLAKTGYEPDDILPLVVAPQQSLREVFELSVFLYGYYEEQHMGIKVDDTGNRIPRDRSNAHTKYLAKSILEYIIAEAVISRVAVNLFKRAEFE